jgi:hypothetical protein
MGNPKSWRLSASYRVKASRPYIIITSQFVESKIFEGTLSRQDRCQTQGWLGKAADLHVKLELRHVALTMQLRVCM